MADKKDDGSRKDSDNRPTRLPTFDEKPKPLQEDRERFRKHDPMISDTYKPPPPKKD